MNKLPLTIQLAIFLCCFVPLAIYMVGGLETEDGRALLIVVLIGGIISTIRAVYLRNKQLKRMSEFKQDDSSE